MTKYHVEYTYWPPNHFGYVGQKSIVQKWWEVQKPPFKKTLPFNYVKQGYISYSSTLPEYSPSGEYLGGGNYPGGNGDAVFMDATTTTNKMYSKTVAQLGDPSQWANNLIEAKESIGMVVNRAGQLISFARNLRKGNFSGAAKALGQPTPSKKQLTKLQKAKSFGDQFLEFHFGWIPAVQDIGASINTLQKADFGVCKIRSTSSGNQDTFYRQDNGGPGHFTIFRNHASVRCRSVLLTRVSNPNAFLANQMGFVNPLSVAWEAVPYSFAVDWFANVGQCLSAMTDFVGVSIIDACTIILHEANATLSHSSTYSYHDASGNFITSGWNDSAVSKGINLSRSASFNGPTLQIKPFKGFSAVRGATAISLLLQHLR